MTINNAKIFSMNVVSEEPNPDYGVFPMEVLPSGPVDFLEFEEGTSDQIVGHGIWRESGLWECLQEDCDGVHHYYVKSAS
jgi:hypothetical protein